MLKKVLFPLGALAFVAISCFAGLQVVWAANEPSPQLDIELRADGTECPGKVTCPLTKELICKDKCPLTSEALALAPVELPTCCVVDVEVNAEALQE